MNKTQRVKPRWQIRDEAKKAKQRDHLKAVQEKNEAMLLKRIVRERVPVTVGKLLDVLEVENSNRKVWVSIGAQPLIEIGRVGRIRKTLFEGDSWKPITFTQNGFFYAVTSITDDLVLSLDHPLTFDVDLLVGK